MSNEVNNMQDIIDSRDVIARIEELESDREYITSKLDELKEELSDIDNLPEDEVNQVDIDSLKEQIEELESELQEWDESEDAQELKILQELASEAEDYASDWRHGEQLIRDSYFVDYCIELVQDIGDLPKDLPKYIEYNIDWEGVARDIQQDYTSVDFDGIDYWIRCS